MTSRSQKKPFDTTAQGWTASEGENNESHPPSLIVVVKMPVWKKWIQHQTKGRFFSGSNSMVMEEVTLSMPCENMRHCEVWLLLATPYIPFHICLTTSYHKMCQSRSMQVQPCQANAKKLFDTNFTFCLLQLTEL